MTDENFFFWQVRSIKYLEKMYRTRGSSFGL